MCESARFEVGHRGRASSEGKGCVRVLGLR